MDDFNMLKKLTCKKCNGISNVGRYCINIDGLEFKTILCNTCKLEFEEKVRDLYKEYSLEPDENYLWDDIDE